jgi:hypothetical protein
MRYKITISELRDSTHEYRSDDEYDIYEVKVAGDETIVAAVQRTVLDYIECKEQVPVMVRGSMGDGAEEQK